jgi:murein DD-endopeptidase MepM/ murein hydrolase activator NlpD
VNFRSDNENEKQAFRFYDELSNGAKERKYTQAISNKTQLGSVSKPSKYDNTVLIRGDETKRLEQAGKSQFFTYDERSDSAKTTSKAAVKTGGGSTSTTSEQTIDCVREGGSGGTFAGTFAVPLPNSTYTSAFGLRGGQPHEGVDFSSCSKRSPGDSCAKVFAAASGTVTILNNNQSGGCGNVVVIKHSDEYTTKYCHLADSSIKVKNGQQVNNGDELGLEGSTGNSSGVHLHFILEKNGKKVDPCKNGLKCPAVGGIWK